MNQITVDQQEAQQGKVYSVLAYLGILVLIPILAAKDNKFARYHANQGLILLIFDVVCSIVGGILGGLLGMIGALISWLLSLACLVFMILGIVNAVKGEAKPLPVIGNLFTLIKSY